MSAASSSVAGAAHSRNGAQAGLGPQRRDVLQRRQGGRPRKMTPEKVAVARQMYTSQKYTVEQIAKALGVTRGTVYAHLDHTDA